MKDFLSTFWPLSRRTWIVVAVFAVTAIVMVAFFTRGSGFQQAPESSAAHGSSADPTATPDEPEPEQSTPIPIPTPSMATVPSDLAAYCAAWKKLGATSPIPADDDEGIDLKELEKVFNELHKHYESAHQAAPPSLRGDYSMVLGYLAQAQQAIKGNDTNEIKIMITNLAVLNPAMAQIDADSRRLCR